MLLTNTKYTGYSLGLPLFWPEKPEELSTGLIQGISISLALPPNAAPILLYIDKYSNAADHITLSITGNGKIICSLDAELSGTYTVFPLKAESNIFISGFVGIYPGAPDRQINLHGAQINPMYVHTSYRNTENFGYFTLVDYNISSAAGSLSSGSIEASGAITITPAVTVPITSIVVADSPAVEFTQISAGVYSCSINPAILSAEPVDSTSINYVNGLPVSSGECTLTLPPTWVVMGNKLCARVGNPSDTPSCAAVDIIQDTLGPQNFPGDNPLSVAFPEGTLNLSAVYAGEVRFNSEYEVKYSAGSAVEYGLVWSEFSSQHDAFTSGGVTC